MNFVIRNFHLIIWIFGVSFIIPRKVITILSFIHLIKVEYKHHMVVTCLGKWDPSSVWNPSKNPIEYHCNPISHITDRRIQNRLSDQTDRMISTGCQSFRDLSKGIQWFCSVASYYTSLCRLWHLSQLNTTPAFTHCIQLLWTYLQHRY